MDVYPDATVGDAVTVADGTYQVLSAGGFVSTADTFADGDYYELKGTSSASYETNVLPTLTIGGVDFVYTITTLAESTRYIDEMLQSELDGMLQSEIDLLLQTRPV